MKRLFVGIPISEDVKEKVKPLLARLKETGASFNFVPLENLHFTVKFLGEVDSGMVDEIKEKLREVVSTKNKFLLKLNSVGSFPGLGTVKVVWVGTDHPKLIALIRDVNQKLNYLRRDDFEKIIPHLTVARVKSGKNQKQLPELLKKFENKDLDDNFGQIIVDKLVLYESKLTPEGPVYSVLEEFVLT